MRDVAACVIRERCHPLLEATFPHRSPPVSCGCADADTGWVDVSRSASPCCTGSGSSRIDPPRRPDPSPKHAGVARHCAPQPLQNTDQHRSPEPPRSVAIASLPAGASCHTGMRRSPIAVVRFGRFIRGKGFSLLSSGAGCGPGVVHSPGIGGGVSAPTRVPSQVLTGSHP